MRHILDDNQLSGKRTTAFLRSIFAMPLRVLVVPDKLKGSLDASKAAEMIERGFKRVRPDTEFTRLPLTDGGEGFVEIITEAAGGEVGHYWTTDPRGERCRARFGKLEDGTAIVGLTEASGLWRIPEAERNSGMMSTEGTGRLITWLATYQADRVIVGLGGSCSTDGGIGLAAPFDFRFRDIDGGEIALTGFGLEDLDHIEPPETVPPAKIIAATDVDNPLYGRKGAAYVFAPQKGASPQQVRQLDRNLQHLAEVSEHDLGRSLHLEKGAGAAGGCGYGLLNFLNAEREAGFDLFARLTNLEALIAEHDLIITGEGALDASSLTGKGPISVARMAKKARKPVFAACGACLSEKARSQFDAVGEIRELAFDPEDAMRRAARHMRHVADRLARIF